MKLHRSIRRYGVVSLLLLAGCLYKFSGGGLPSHIRTVAVLPFENQTAAAELTRELSDALTTTRQLGRRKAGWRGSPLERTGARRTRAATDERDENGRKRHAEKHGADDAEGHWMVTVAI